jgi:hypothetical protein
MGPSAMKRSSSSECPLSKISRWSVSDSKSLWASAKTPCSESPAELPLDPPDTLPTRRAEHRLAVVAENPEARDASQAAGERRPAVALELFASPFVDVRACLGPGEPFVLDHAAQARVGARVAFSSSAGRLRAGPGEERERRLDGAARRIARAPGQRSR